MLLVGDALWCPETLNDLVGITDRHVVARGHSSLFVYDATTGARLARISAPHQRMMDVAWIESLDATTILVARHAHPSVELAFAGKPTLRERPDVTVEPVPRPEMRTCVSRDGRTRVRAEQTRVVVERDGAVVQSFPGHWSYYQVAASADGALVAFGGERIRVGVVATGEVRIASDPPGHVSGLAVAGARRVRVDAIGGARLFHAGDRVIAELTDAPRIVGDTIVGVGLRSLGRWDVETGAVIEHAKLAGKIAQIAWSRDGRRAAVATYETTGLLLIPHAGITLYEDAKPIGTWEGETDPEVDAQAPSFALARDGTTIVLLNEAELVTCSLPGFTPIDRRAIEPGAQGIFYTPGGRLAISYDDKLELEGGATLALYSGWAHAWSDAKYYAHASTDGVVVRDAATLAVLETLPIHDVVALAIDDDRNVMWADRDGRTGVELPA